MSIAITLLGHSSKNKEGFRAGDSTGAGSSGFLHLAYANSENGEGFSKTNINTDGHIAFYPYIGMCISDDRDDESLSFHSYDWSNVGYGDSSSQQGGTPGDNGNNGTGGNGNNGTGGNGNNGCSCATCCNYKYCGGGDNPNVNPITIISPQIIEYVKPECVDDGEMHETDQEYHLMFYGEPSSIGYSIDYNNKDEGAQASVKWNLALRCQQYPIRVIAAYDFYQGWIYLADFYDGWSDDIRLIFTNLHDSLDDQGVHAKDGKWHYSTFETDPILKFNNGTSVTPTEYETLNDQGEPTGTKPIEKAVAKWEGDNLLNTLFGEQKTIRIHECDWEGINDNRYNVYDCIIKYRWISNSFGELYSQLPKSYDIEYNDLSRHTDFVLYGQTKEKSSTYNNVIINAGQIVPNEVYQLSVQGCEVFTQRTGATETTQDPRGNTIYVRYFNGYNSTWLNTTTVMPSVRPNDNKTDEQIIKDNLENSPDRIFDDTFGTIMKNYDLSTHKYCYTIYWNDNPYDCYDNGSTLNTLKFIDNDNTFEIYMYPADYSFEIKMLKGTDSYPNTITIGEYEITKSYSAGDYLHPIYSLPTYPSTFSKYYTYSPEHDKFIPGFPERGEIQQEVYVAKSNSYAKRKYLNGNTNTVEDRGDEIPVTYLNPSTKKIYNFRTDQRIYDYLDLVKYYENNTMYAGLSDHYVDIT